MADDNEVCDFISEKITRNDLITALNDMVIEYKKLSDSYNEIYLKNKSDNTNLVTQNNESNILKNNVTELFAENENLKAIVQSTTLENLRLNHVVSAWTKSSNALKQLQEQQRPAGCKSDLGYIENNTDESNNKLNPVKDKLKFISFIKGNSADSLADIKSDNEKLIF